MAFASPDFYPNETKIQGSIGLYDPEFDPYSSQAIWQSGQELWVAPVNPITGDILIQSKVLIANDLAPISPSRSDSGGFSARTSNGPEWLTSQNGSEILYTRAPTPDPATWQVWSASWDGLKWITRYRTFGSTPIGSTSSSDANPRFLYRKTTKAGGTESSPLRIYDYNSASSSVISRTGTYGARWVNDESNQVVYAADDADGNPQVFIYDIASGIPRQITFEETLITRPYIWRAPELGDRLALLAIERSTEGAASERMAIYTEKPNGDWNRILTLAPPTNRAYIYSAEPSLYGRSSVISLAAKDKLNLSSEGDIWMVIPFTSTGPFYRKISGDDALARNDPESFPTAKELVFYYNTIGVDYSGASGLAKASTGLIPAPVYFRAAPPLASESNIAPSQAARTTSLSPLAAKPIEIQDSDILHASTPTRTIMPSPEPDMLRGGFGPDIFTYTDIGLGGIAASSSSWNEITEGDLITGFTPGVDAIDISATRTGGGAIAIASGSQPSESFNSRIHSLGIANTHFDFQNNLTANAIANAIDAAFNQGSHGITIDSGVYYFAMPQLGEDSLLSYNVFELINTGAMSATFSSPNILISHLCRIDSAVTAGDFIL